MELLSGALLGALVAIVVFVLLSRARAGARDDVAVLAASARGEERLRSLQSGIDASLREVRDSVSRVSDVVRDIDRARGESVADVAAVVRESRRQLDLLTTSTTKLTTLLGGNQSRGQWGERVAEDILRAAGFVEGVSYDRNRRIEGGTTRPDFSFRLPEQRVLHMDVKFPLANYARWTDAPDDVEREAALRAFIADVRARVKSVTGRDYIDPGGGTLDFVLLFIPNEQVYGFVHEHDPRLADDALAQQVVLCSPLTLFAVLSVIRRSVDAFALHHQADEILRALATFGAQWGRYKDSVDTVARRFDAALRALDDVRGVRTRQLERQIERVEELRLEAGIALDDEAFADDAEAEATPITAVPPE
ncbi:MAG: DNA recombination protein RmuC [Chloroflexi bacterium]|nr:DNA recombination protein RmuC [Chloroflexota bacterium]MDA1002129.1 DNA recombination protein RmuC [Chloroflexota bacterium]